MIPNVSLNCGLITGIVVNRSGVTLMARLLGNLGTPITIATVASIAWKVSDLTTGLAVASGTFTVATTVFDSLQMDSRWTLDNANALGPDQRYGYNFLAVLPAATFAATVLTGQANLTPADRLRCDVTFTPVSGEVFAVPFEWVPIASY